MKQVIRLTESDLHRMIKESVKQVLRETRLDYDEDNFSGRHYLKQDVDDFIDPEGYIDDPNNTPSFDSKDKENDYSWYKFDFGQGVTPNALGYGKYARKGADKLIKKDIEDSLYNRNTQKYWTQQDIDRANRLKNRWVNGKCSTEWLEDAL